MANDKDIIKKLFSVVEKQQKTITKLAQAMGQAGLPMAGENAPQSFDINKSQKKPAAALLEAMPDLRQKVSVLEARGNDMLIRFKPEHSNDTNFNAVLNKMQELTDAGVFTQKLNLKEV